MKRALIGAALAVMLCAQVAAQGLALGHSKDPDPNGKRAARLATTQLAIPMAAAPVIRVYKNLDAWTPREEQSLSALGKTQGTDWFVHLISDCASGIPAGTQVVYFTSNAYGDGVSTAQQRDPACQAALATFLAGGGKLVVDMGDNDGASGFLAPGSTGTPTYLFPDVIGIGNDVSPTAEALGADLTAGTPDDHPFLEGPDGVPGTGDDVTDANSDGCCYQAHGSLDQGITLPPSAKPLLVARFQTVPRPILAEYCQGPGRVIVNTMTNGYYGWLPNDTFPSAGFAQTSMLAYVLSTGSNCAWPFKGFFSPVDNPPVLNSMKAGSAVPLKFSLEGNRGLNIIAAGYPVSQPVACDNGVLSDSVTETSTAGQSTLSYDEAQDQYIYVWKTEKGWAGSCRMLTLKLNDGTTHTATFRMNR